MAKKELDPLEQEEQTAWTGYGFLQGLIKAKQARLELNIQYAAENPDGTVGKPHRSLFSALKEMQSGARHLWIVRTYWRKDNAGKWQLVIPDRSYNKPGEPPRWYRIDLSRGLLAFAGNLLAGPHGKAPYLNLPRPLLTKLRSGNITPKVRKGLLKVIEPPQARTIVQCRKAVGVALVQTLVNGSKTDPAGVAATCFAIAARWALIDHILGEGKEFGRQTRKIVRAEFRKALDETASAGIPKALHNAVVALKHHPESKIVYEAMRKPVLESLEAFLVEIVYHSMPDVQRIFALDGGHKFTLTVRKQLNDLGSVTSRILDTSDPKSVPSFPNFASKSRRLWLIRESAKLNLYLTLRKVSQQDGFVGKGHIPAFRFGGASTAANAAPTKDLSFHVSVLKALAEAAGNHVNSPVLWSGRFNKDDCAFYSSAVTPGTAPTHGYCGLSMDLPLRQFILSNVNVVVMANSIGRASTDANAGMKDLNRSLRISQIVSNLALNSSIYRARASLLIRKEMEAETDEQLRAMYNLMLQATAEDTIQAAYWTTSLLIQYIATAQDIESATRFLGSFVREEIMEAKSRKLRSWIMFRHLELNLTSTLISHASVELAKRVIVARPSPGEGAM